MLVYKQLIIFMNFFIIHKIFGQNVRALPQVDKIPNLLDSYVPPTMQIIAHLTEQMKYDLKPTTIATTTTTTSRPTQPHLPGIVAPTKSTLREKFDMPTGHNQYFDRYHNLRELSENDQLNLQFGPISADLIRLVNQIDDELIDDNNIDKQLDQFSKNYDNDYEFVKEKLLKELKKTPPTRAYVGLLSLYDLLNKEAKKLGLNKYNGYTDGILKQLIDYSSGTSADQLKFVLKQLNDRKDVKNQQIIRRIEQFLNDLNENSSYLNAALRHIPPLIFVE